MPQRRKRLVDLARDGTFLARKDEHLLGQRDPLLWKGLEAYRLRFLAAESDRGRRAVALELEKSVRQGRAGDLLGDLQSELRRLGPPGSFKQLAGFFARFLRHSAGPAAGLPFKLERFQRDFLREFYRRDPETGERIYTTGLLGVPKGNGKTPLTAGIGTHSLVTQTDAPEVYSVAGARDQADIAHEFARVNIEDGELAAWLSVGTTIRCNEHRGEYSVLSSDGDLSHGTKPSAYLVDEWWQFIHRKHREAYNAGRMALHKRPGEAFLLAITTAGYDITSQLGETYQIAIDHPLLETRNRGALLVVRDEDAGFLFWWYQIPEDADIEDPDWLRRANPLSVVRPDDLLRELRSPDVDELDWLRLHANRWTKTRKSWLSAGVWPGLRSENQIPAGAAVTVGIDAARTWDTTSVGWVWISPEGRKVGRAHIWSVRRNVPHHTFVDGGELVNEELVEPFIHELAKRYRIRGIALDPRYLNAESKHLADAGFTVVKVEPQSTTMQDAVALFEKDALAGRIEHDGDRAVTGHVEAVDATRRPDGSKKIGKRSDAHPIDAAIALILAGYLPETDLPSDEPVEYVFDLRAFCKCGHPEGRHQDGTFCREPGCGCVLFVDREAE